MEITSCKNLWFALEKDCLMLSQLATSLVLATTYLLIPFSEKRIKNINKLSMITHIPNVLVDGVPSWDWRRRNVKDIPYLREAFIDSSLLNNSRLIVYLRFVSSHMTNACPFFQCITHVCFHVKIPESMNFLNHQNLT